MSNENSTPLFQIPTTEPKQEKLETAATVDQRSELIRLLDASVGKHFVFLFGSPAAGKTAVLGSILQAMQRPEVRGKLYVHGAGDSYFKHGLILWDQIRRAFEKKEFPARTTAGKTIQLHAQYKPANEGADPLEIVFLEMAGEDLRGVMITDGGGRSLPFHIGQFLKVPELKIAFLITTSWRDAQKDDTAINDFLSFVNEAAPHLIDNRIILLITKWDSNPTGSSISIDEFVSQKMPGTFNKIASKRNIIQPFSVGKILSFDGAGGDIISSFDYTASQRLFSRIYETFTGITSAPDAKSIDAPKSKKWWQI